MSKRTTERFVEYVDLGKDGSKWKHGYIPENPAAVALKHHRKPGEGAPMTSRSRAHVHANAVGSARESSGGASELVDTRKIRAGHVVTIPGKGQSTRKVTVSAVRHPDASVPNGRSYIEHSGGKEHFWTPADGRMRVTGGGDWHTNGNALRDSGGGDKVTETHRYSQRGNNVFDNHTGKVVGAGSALENNGHWRRQVEMHGGKDRALAAFDASSKRTAAKSALTQAGGIGDNLNLRLPEGHSVRTTEDSFGTPIEVHYDSAGKKIGTVYPKGGKDGPNALYTFNDKNGIPSSRAFSNKNAAHQALVAGNNPNKAAVHPGMTQEERIKALNGGVTPGRRMGSNESVETKATGEFVVPRGHNSEARGGAEARANLAHYREKGAYGSQPGEGTLKVNVPGGGGPSATRIKLLEGNLASFKRQLAFTSNKDQVRRQIAAVQALLKAEKAK